MVTSLPPPLSIREACRALRVSRYTLVRYIAHGKVAAFRLPGGQFRILSSEVERIRAASAFSAQDRG